MRSVVEAQKIVGNELRTRVERILFKERFHSQWIPEMETVKRKNIMRRSNRASK